MCGYCLRDMVAGTEQEHYLENHLQDLFSCLLCQEAFHLSIDAVLHLQDVHGETSSQYISRPAGFKCFLCRLCSQRFYNRSCQDLEEHFRLCHRQGISESTVRFLCRICSWSGFSSETNLNQHLRIVHENKNLDAKNDIPAPLVGSESRQLKWRCIQCRESNSIKDVSCSICQYIRPARKKGSGGDDKPNPTFYSLETTIDESNDGSQEHLDVVENLLVRVKDSLDRVENSLDGVKDSTT